MWQAAMATSSIGAELVATLLANRWRAIETPDQQISSIVECIVKHRPPNGICGWGPCPSGRTSCPSGCHRIWQTPSFGFLLSTDANSNHISTTEKIFHLIIRIDSPASHQPASKLFDSFMFTTNAQGNNGLSDYRVEQLVDPSRRKETKNSATLSFQVHNQSDVRLAVWLA